MMETHEIALIYTTLPSREAAKAMARSLLEARLAACCNILAPMTALYRWEGRLTEDEEIPMLIKTRRALTPAAIEAARAHHPYQVPCFLLLPVAGAHEPYLDWLLQETRE
ncbi:MAG: divalent-cation tolerance protein CutA [Alphaproteobacteria bacterium]|nr:divalent-cation tolerance protein CutA [Alphaproteobacteria bacterium]